MADLSRRSPDGRDPDGRHGPARGRDGCPTRAPVAVTAPAAGSGDAAGMLRRTALVSVLLGLTVPVGAGASTAGVDLLERDRGNETPATAERLAVDRTLAGQVVLGPAEHRDVDVLVVRVRRGTTVTVRLRHRGEVDHRALGLGVATATGAAPLRWRTVGDGRETAVRVRVPRGRLVIALRCAAGRACDGGGAIPYALRVDRPGRRSTLAAAAASTRPVADAPGGPSTDSGGASPGAVEAAPASGGATPG